MASVYDIVAGVEKDFIYLAYGSNMHPARLSERCPSARVLGKSRWPGRLLKFHKLGRDGSGKGNALWTGSNQDCIWGVLYQIRLSEKPQLDAAENLGEGYEEIHLECHRDQALLKCLSYQAQKKYIQEELTPFDWYLQYLIQAARAFGFPEVYRQKIEGFPTQVDGNKMRSIEEQQRGLRRISFLPKIQEPFNWEIREL